MTDETDVAFLIARVAHTADAAADVDDNIALYTPSAEWLMNGNTVTGHDALRAAAVARRTRGEAGPGTQSRHVITTQAVSVDGDTATAESYWMFYVNTATEPRLASMGHYTDTCVRTPVGWRISRRDITLG